MNQTRISAYAQRAGRLHVNGGTTPTASISPLAAPSTFALRHGLQIDFIAREEYSDGFVVALLLKNADGLGVVVAGTITSNYDDHGSTIADDLDFLPMDEAQAELHIALDELFGDRAPKHRQQLLRMVA